MFGITPFGSRVLPGGRSELEADQRIARYDNYRDWHRVERARDVFASEVVALKARGWQVVSVET